ncbi:MAG: hypothetical protein ACP5U2_14320 [Bryobacteraceae bacterium]
MTSLMIRWPEADPRAVPLLGEAGTAYVWLPWDAPGDCRAFVEACHRAGMRVIAELGPEQAGKAGEARAAGFEGVAWEAGGAQEKEVRDVAAKHAGWEMFLLLDPARIGWPVEPARAVLRAGLWPGSRRPEPGEASATQHAWLDANVHLIAWLRAHFPARPAILGYRADEAAGLARGQRVPFWTSELSLAEAAVAGGSVVLSAPDAFREALLAGQGMAREAWQSLARTARFLRDHAAEFQRPVASRVAVIAGDLEECGEILNLMFRHNVTPAVLPASRPGPLGQFRVVAGAGLGKYREAVRSSLEFARAGGHLLVAPAAENEPAWWKAPGLRKLRAEQERDVYALGRGLITVYRAPVADPGEFALDVIDALGWRTRDLRIWGADALIGLLHRQPDGSVSLELVNYGGKAGDFLVRLEGHFRRALLRQSGAAPVELRAAIRGSGTEVEMPRISRVASLLLS